MTNAPDQTPELNKSLFGGKRVVGAFPHTQEQAIEKYDDAEPRDASGKWTAGGGAAASGGGGESKSPKIQRWEGRVADAGKVVEDMAALDTSDAKKMTPKLSAAMTRMGDLEVKVAGAFPTPLLRGKHMKPYYEEKDKVWAKAKAGDLKGAAAHAHAASLHLHRLASDRLKLMNDREKAGL